MTHLPTACRTDHKLGIAAHALRGMAMMHDKAAL